MLSDYHFGVYADTIYHVPADCRADSVCSLWEHTRVLPYMGFR
jgi:hypothetical protein